MHKTRPVTPTWYARTSVRRLTAVISLSLATLAVVLAFERTNPAPPDAAPAGGWVPYVNQVGAALAGDSAPLRADDAPVATGSMPAVSHRDPSVPAITFVPNAVDAQVPAAPTF